MINKDDILDELFRSKLDDFEQVPPSYVWMKIREKQKEGKRRRTLYAMRIGGIAAAVLLAFLLGWQLQEHRELLKESPVVAERDQPEDQVHEQQQPKENRSSSVQEPATSEKRQASLKKKNAMVKAENKQEIQDLAEVPAYQQPSAFLAMTNVKIETPGVIRELKSKRENELKLTEEDRKIIEMNKRYYGTIPDAKEDKSWSIGAQVSPAYSVNQGSYHATYASNMSGPGERQSLALGGGISVRYEVGKRWSVQSGLQYNRLNQSSGSSGNREDTMFSPSKDQLGYTYYNNKVHREPTGQMVMNGSAGVIEIERLPSSVRVSASLESTAESQMLLTSDDFEQRFGYIEVPLLVRYKLIDKTWNMHMLGGFSANMLVGNEVFINDGDGHSYVGKTKDMSRMNYSTSIGFGMGYRLTDKIQLNIEPQLKYYLRSLNDNPDVHFQPYSIGIYTGVSYRF
jgi:hypothetical protein